jgi:hypothetical protein
VQQRVTMLQAFQCMRSVGGGGGRGGGKGWDQQGKVWGMSGSEPLGSMATMLQDSLRVCVGGGGGPGQSCEECVHGTLVYREAQT